MPNDTANASLIAELNAATEGLLFQSESDYPVSTFFLPGSQGETLSTETVSSLVNSGQKGPVSEIPFNDFFATATTEQDWQEAAEKESVKRFQNLVQVLNDNLSGIRVFRIGDTEAEVFVIGKTASGDFAGVSTTVVET